MQVIRSSTVTNKQKLFPRNLALTLGLGGSGLIILLLPLTGILPESFGQSGWGFWVAIIAGVGLIGGGIWFGWQTWNYLQSRQAQERLCQELSRFLDNEFIYFRNLTLPGTRSVGEIDGVLLGPHGALVMELEHSQGEFASEGDTWYRYLNLKDTSESHKNRRRMDDSPTWAAIRAGREVKAWLSVRELPLIPVRPVVVLSRGKIRSVKRPSCPVVELWSIQSFIESNLLQNPTQPVASGSAVEQIAQRLQA